MLDVQRERLRHLVANAILELWKKETGSLSPVIIEGTICITAGNGRTTVVQVSNQFSSAIPDGADYNGPNYHTPKRKNMAIYNPFDFSPNFEFAPNSSRRNSDDQSFQGLTPSSTDLSVSKRKSSSRLHSFSKNHSNSLSSCTSEKSMDISEIKDETCNSDIDVCANEDDSGVVTEITQTSTGPVIPGTGFYMADEDGKTEHETEKKADTTFSTEEPEKKSAGPLMSTPKPDIKDKRSLLSSPAADALDLSSARNKEDDLALSSPQNYTAQVRNVIRQRLLATRHNSTDSKDNPQAGNENGDENVEPVEGDEDSQSPPTSDYGLSPLPPLMNLNLTSPTMLPIPYPPMLRSPMPPSPSPVSDMLRLSRQQESPVFPPDMFSPGRSLASNSSSGSYDQNGNDKETLYTNEKGEPQKVYRCNFCSKTFLFKSKYYEHLPVHTNVRPFQCHLCSRTYKYKYDLRVHLRTHMGIPTKSTVCPFCSVKFDTNKMLRLHIQDYHHSAASQMEPSPAASESGGSTSEAVSPAT